MLKRNNIKNALNSEFSEIVKSPVEAGAKRPEFLRKSLDWDLF